MTLMETIFLHLTIFIFVSILLACTFLPFFVRINIKIHKGEYNDDQER